jgi:uncharacterized protein (DUF2141 family)
LPNIHPHLENAMPDTPLIRAMPTLLLGLSCLAAMTAIRAEGTGSVEVRVGPVQGSAGQVGCQLFNNPAGFPLAHGAAVQSVLAPIDQARATCVFDALAPGSYAVAVVHDTNGNQRIDTNALGLPTEAYGVSNNRTRALSAPRWEEARFQVETGQRVQLDVRLRY